MLIDDPDVELVTPMTFKRYWENINNLKHILIGNTHGFVAHVTLEMTWMLFWKFNDNYQHMDCSQKRGIILDLGMNEESSGKISAAQIG